MLVGEEYGNTLGDCDMDGIADGNTGGAPDSGIDLLVTLFWVGKDEGGNELLGREEYGNTLGDCDMDGISDGNTDGAPSVL